ncbi:hypothetical protein PJN93_30585, partial [Mycobacterium kansasii]
TLLGALPDRSRIPHAGEIGDCWAIHATTEFAGWPDWQDAWVIGPWDDGVTAFFGIECADVPEVP